MKAYKCVTYSQLFPRSLSVQCSM